jgi:hypothetical protein
VLVVVLPAVSKKVRVVLFVNEALLKSGLEWLGESYLGYGIGNHHTLGMQYHCINKRESPDGQCMGKMAIEGLLDSMVDEIVVDKNAEKVGIISIT